MQDLTRPVLRDAVIRVGLGRNIWSGKLGVECRVDLVNQNSTLALTLDVFAFGVLVNQFFYLVILNKADHIVSLRYVIPLLKQPSELTDMITLSQM